MQGLFACEEDVCGNDTGEVGASKELIVCDGRCVFLAWEGMRVRVCAV